MQIKYFLFPISAEKMWLVFTLPQWYKKFDHSLSLHSGSTYFFQRHRLNSDTPRVAHASHTRARAYTHHTVGWISCWKGRRAMELCFMCFSSQGLLPYLPYRPIKCYTRVQKNQGRSEVLRCVWGGWDRHFVEIGSGVGYLLNFIWWSYKTLVL